MSRRLGWINCESFFSLHNPAGESAPDAPGNCPQGSQDVDGSRNVHTEPAGTAQESDIAEGPEGMAVRSAGQTGPHLLALML